MKTIWGKNILCLLVVIVLLLLSACVGDGKEEHTTLDRSETQSEIPIESKQSESEPQSVQSTSESESGTTNHSEPTTDDSDAGWFTGWY